MALKPPEEKTVLQRYLPIVEWLPRYDWGGSLRFDVIAALAVWALLVPEAMAYAGIAGVSPEVGLVTAPLALIGYPPIEELEDLLSAALETSVIVTVNQLPTLSETYSDADGGTVSTPGPADGS